MVDWCPGTVRLVFFPNVLLGEEHSRQCWRRQEQPEKYSGKRGRLKETGGTCRGSQAKAGGGCKVCTG